MPNYPSSFVSGAAPGLRSVNNVTDRRDFQYFLEPSAASAAGFAISIATFVALPTVSAVGNSLTYAAAGGGIALTVDNQSAALVNGTSTILVKNQSTASQNGLYVITNKGATGTSWILTRDSRFDEDAEFKLDTIFSIGAGTTNGSTLWYLATSEPVTVGTTNLTFTQVPTSIDYPSSANYPTDVNVGMGRTNLASDFINDFKSMINTVQKDLGDLETEINALDTIIGTKYLASSNIYTIQHIHRRFEKLIFQIKRLKDDVDLMNNGSYFHGAINTLSSIGVTGSYPSSKNRLTNVTGGF